MRLLLDQGLPRSAVERLRSAGFDAVHVGDAGHATSSDRAILDLASAEARVIITLDADFHRLLALSDARRPSVVRIRLEGLKGPGLSTLLEELLPRFETELRAGAVLTVRQNGVGIRSLPLLNHPTAMQSQET